MATREIAGKTVNVSADGYFTNPAEWSKEVGEELAKEAGIAMTDKHWAVIEFLRQRQAAGEALTIRRVGSSGITDIKEFYQLFPGGPLKISSKIAGIPKPMSCV